ncbi:MAG TPA: hypothetical protein VJ867_11910 [Gemmatimonadaceae bacterium]|nr:hypothetical protein [Gemmatimonadaceae bacterium]
MLAGCSAPTPGTFVPRDVDTALTNAIRRGPGALVSLDSVGPADWRFLFVFGPGTTVDAIRRCVGESHGFETFALDRRDDVDVLIFEGPKGDLSSIEVSRAAAPFGEDALTRRYPRGGAHFAVRAGRTAPHELAAADTVNAPRCI